MQTDVITISTSVRFPRRDTNKFYPIYRSWALIWCTAVSTDQCVCRSLRTQRNVQRQDGRSLRIMISYYLAGGYRRFGDTRGQFRNGKRGQVHSRWVTVRRELRLHFEPVLWTVSWGIWIIASTFTALHLPSVMSVLSADSCGFSSKDAIALGDQSCCYTEHRYMGGMLHMKPSWLTASIGGKKINICRQQGKDEPIKAQWALYIPPV